MFCGTCGSRQPGNAVYCWNCGSQLSSRPQPADEAARVATALPQATAAPQAASADHQEGPEPATWHDDLDHAGNARVGKENRSVKIGIISVLALVVLAVGAYSIFSVARSGTTTSQTLSASRLSLPGISLEPPQGWTSFPSSESGTLVMAPPGATSTCPNTPSSSPPARCIEAVTISRSEPAGLNVSSPDEAVQQLVNGRFSALHSSIRHTTALTQKSFTADGCLTAFSEWRVSWTAPPDTIEGWVVIQTNTVYQNSYFASVFIRLTAQSDGSAEKLANNILSSIRCS
jgi:hypothetical protein